LVWLQLQDDFHAFGNPETLENKLAEISLKTKPIYLKQLLLFSNEKKETERFISVQPEDNTDKIERVKALLIVLGASKATQDAIQEFTFKAFQTLTK
jgi:geranylgeranyl diphosphate synthase type II